MKEPTKYPSVRYNASGASVSVADADADDAARKEGFKYDTPDKEAQAKADAAEKSEGGKSKKGEKKDGGE